MTKKQPKPQKNKKQPKIKDLVFDELKQRVEDGRVKYGTYLQPFNGRSSLQDLKEELYDGSFYLKQLEVELKELWEDLNDLKLDPYDYPEGLVDASWIRDRITDLTMKYSGLFYYAKFEFGS